MTFDAPTTRKMADRVGLVQKRNAKVVKKNPMITKVYFKITLIIRNPKHIQKEKSY